MFTIVRSCKYKFTLSVKGVLYVVKCDEMRIPKNSCWKNKIMLRNDTYLTLVVVYIDLWAYNWLNLLLGKF